MEPKIIDKEQITLVGMVFYGNPFKEQGGWSQENEIGKLWTRFLAKKAKKAWVTRRRRKAIARKTEQGGSWIWKEYKIHERLDECFARGKPWKIPLTEKDVPRLLVGCFPEVTEGIPFQIIPHLPREMKAPGRPGLLFILVKTNNFADRTLEALAVARTCKGKVEAILYITLSWAVNLDQRLASIAKIFRDYGVASICRREPVKASPLIYY